VDFDLSDEQALIKQTAREFTDKEVVPRAGENSRNHHFDLELVRKIADQGYLGAIVPREYGGAGLDYLTYAIVCEEIGRGCSAMRTVISVQTSLVCSTILKWGTEEQKQRYLPPLCSGEWLACFGLTEPDTGSDAANQKTRAVQQDDGSWKLNGSKMWISLGNHAKLALVFAQTDPALRHKGLACFWSRPTSPATSPRRSRQDGPVGVGHRADRARRHRRAPTRCSAGRRRLQGRDERAGLRALLRGRRLRRHLPGLVEESVKYATGAPAFARPIASFQLVQEMIADMVVRTDAARMLVYRAGALKDAGKPSTTETSIAKYFATEARVLVRRPRDPGPRRRRLRRRPPGRALLSATRA
jgi:alkylation response protein AidB-like acyl-CoA dehydrogenase